jgi:hypothetical protein
MSSFVGEDMMPKRLAIYNCSTRAPTETEHNARARVLRNGLAVVGYALLEDFLRNRTVEVVERIGDGHTPFEELPKGIKLAATEGVFNAVRFQQRFMDRRDPDMILTLQEHARHVASTAESSYSLSPFSFVHEQSNISSKDIEKVLQAFKVTSPWSAMGSVAGSCGVGVFALKDAFEAAANRRHAAAHQADADIEYGDLSDYDVEALGVAVGFDLLISRALRQILDANVAYLSRNGTIAGNHIGTRTLRYDGKKWWREVLTGNTRATNRNPSLQTLRVGAIGRARTGGQAVIVQDERGLPSAWYTPDTD